ncbi:transmembrane protein 267 [Galleria mellonella]|uniref:Transmembrane protein 267 n=1 Tax=Galleria mellonella TaxID=7137 RepID=A0A6J1WTJ2_GALME|nr:transmembrane protein 267 [Galleria mellonella]
MKLQFALTLSIFATAFIGDYVVFKSKFSHSQIFRACSDSLVHASIGFLSSVLFFSHENLMDSSSMFNIAICTFMSSFIDVDHIFVARSLQWKDLTNLKQRGIFHCTTFWLVLTTSLLIYSYIYKKIHIYVITWMLIVAYTSHHIRDANRRGLWLYPYGHTPPFHKYIYIFLVGLLPNLLTLLYNCWKPNIYKHTVINYKLIV